MQLEHGKIHKIEPDADAHGCAIKARVLPSTSDAAPTRPLTIPWWLRGTLGNLEVDTDVVFATFDDLTGIIISRADGDGGELFPWDIGTDNVTLETHTHTCPDGETSSAH